MTLHDLIHSFSNLIPPRRECLWCTLATLHSPLLVTLLENYFSGIQIRHSKSLALCLSLLYAIPHRQRTLLATGEAAISRGGHALPAAREFHAVNQIASIFSFDLLANSDAPSRPVDPFVDASLVRALNRAPNSILRRSATILVVSPSACLSLCVAFLNCSSFSVTPLLLLLSSSARERYLFLLPSLSRCRERTENWPSSNR